jgi:phage terminase small subunit
MTSPTPPQLRVANGTHRKDLHGSATAIKSEPVLIKVPPVPRGKRAEFKRRWKFVCQQLVNVGILTGRDVFGVEQLCDAYQEVYDAEQRIKKDGLYMRGRQAGLVLHPAAREKKSRPKENL